MKIKTSVIRTFIVLSVFIAEAAAFAGTDIWTGGGGSANLFWLSTANWNPAAIPQSGDNLIFTNTASLINSNNIPTVNGIFNSITFATPSGAFVLSGNSITVTNISDLQVITPESINLPITDNGNLNVNVVANGLLNLNGVISGSGALTNNGAGTLSLNGSNTFTGPLVINTGTVIISKDTNLPAGNVIINGGTLQSTATATLNTNRGFAVGPSSGSGQGIISVNNQAVIPSPVTALTYGGIIANNGGGIGGLTKIGFGNLILFGPNTYTGTTSNRVGTLTVDFSQSGALLNNIINSSSPLVFGGDNAGAGITNFTQLVVTNGSATVSQTFNNTHVMAGANSIVRVASGSGNATLAFGALDHERGGTLLLVKPAAGNITTTTANNNGILGGWATIGSGSINTGWNVATNWAANDGSGNIINFTDYMVYNSTASPMKNYMNAISNIYVTGVTGTFSNDFDGVGSTNNINTIVFNALPAGTSFIFGSNNMVRLGVSGALLNKDSGSANWHVGTAGVAGNQTNQISYLTAGGPNNDTAGEIDIITTATGSGSANNWDIDPVITDNGSGSVTVIKTGSGYTKLRNHNTYSGGTYLLGGRVQLAGGDIGTANPDGFGTGPLYIFPGAYLFGTYPTTPVINIAGIGTVQEPDGAIRLSAGTTFTNTLVMFGDAGLGGGATTNLTIVTGPISGPYNMYLGAEGNTGGTANGLMLSNQCLWTGNTILVGRLGGNNGWTRIALGFDNVLPNGSGKGDLIIGVSADTVSRIGLDLNGYNQVINGLFSGSATVANNQVFNSSNSTTATLTIGNNDASGTWGGIISDSGAPLYNPSAGITAITKIGAGVETFTNANTYSGATTISNGVLQLSGSGTIANSSRVNIFGGKLDVSSLAGFSFGTQIINIVGGTLFINTASGSSPANFTNGTLQVASLSTGTPNLTVPNVTLGGSTNAVQPLGIPLIGAYPISFRILNYTTSLIGDTNTLTATLPSGYVGYVTNDPATKTILLVLTNGPVTPSLTWVGFSSGTLNSTWDFVASDWTNVPAHTAASYADGSIAIFDDIGRTNVVNLTTTFAPAGLQVNNTNINYTFIGTGFITGTNGFTKAGPGKLTLDNTGGDNYTGVFNITGGTVQIGKNDTGGSLGSSTGNVGNDGLIIFNRTDNLSVTNVISGLGSLLVSNAFGTTITLNGINTFAGTVNVIVSNVLKAGSASAFGSTNGGTVVANGAGLDVNGQNLSEAVTLSGVGLLNLDGSTNGALFNSSAAAASIGSVTLTGNTTLGCTPDAVIQSNRLDIRGLGAKLDTGGNAYNIIKVGVNQLSLVGVAVDAALNDVDVKAGVLDLEGGTTGLGNPSANLFLANGTTLQLVSLTNKLSKQIQAGTTLSDTIAIIGNVAANGTANNTISGSMTVNGSVTINAASGGSFTLSNAVSGAGALTKIGTGMLTVAGTDSHTGGITINDGTLVFNSTNNSTAGSSQVTMVASASPVPVIFGGNGTFKGAADIEDTIWPGVGGRPSTLNIGHGVDYSVPGTGDPGFGALVLGLAGDSRKAIFSLNTSTTTGSGVNDLVNVSGGINANSAKVQINPLTPLSTGSIYTLMTYTSGAEASAFGSASIYTNLQASPNRYQFALQDTGNGLVRLTVTSGAGALVWTNAAGTGIWDVTNSFNWFNTGGGTNDYFSQLDTVVFDDSAPAASTNVTLAVYTNLSGINVGLLPAIVTVNSTNNNFTLAGSGKISGNASIVKKGPSTLTISTANDFTGNVMVSGGTLTVNNTNALGAASSVTTVTNGGTLDVGGASFSANQNPLLGSRQILVSGWGVSSNGAVVNNGASGQNNAFLNLTLAGDTALGGNARWDVGRPSIGSGVLSTGGNAYNLYKVGTNFIAFLGVNVDTNLANIEVRSGFLGFQQGTLSMGNPASTLTVSTNATLEFFGTAGTNNFTKQFVLNGDGVAASITNDSGVTTINGTMTLNGNVILGVSGTTLTNNCLISGTGSLTKNSGGSLVLTTNETYTGNTTINAGSLTLQGIASIDNSTNTTVLAGATLNVNSRNNSTFTVNANRTLSGNGTIAGSLSNASGGTLTLGTNGAVSILTVTTNAYLNGTTVIKLNASANTNDVLIAGVNVFISGTLNVTNIAGSLAGGQVYKLFNAVAYVTNNPVIVPSTPGANMAWDTSSLGADGTLRIVSTGPAPTPHITTISLTGTTLSISATNGTSGTTWTLLQSTNVAIPFAQWITNRTGTFDGGGNMSTNIANVATNTQTFYILKN